tara:strand:+ start:161 stop:280 length:120 start_codon:yes stop_codon:yes gene_type:complete
MIVWGLIYQELLGRNTRDWADVGIHDGLFDASVVSLAKI